MPQQNIHTSRSSKKSLPSSSLTRHCNDMSPAVDRTRVSSESWYLLVWWMSWDDLNSCDLQKVWPWWFSNLGARPYTVLALDNCCQIGQMPQFRVLIVRYGASKPCCLQLACLCPITFLDLAWHATLRPAPPPRPNGQHVMYLTRFMRDKVCACVNVCVGRALRTLHLERGFPCLRARSRFQESMNLICGRPQECSQLAQKGIKEGNLRLLDQLKIQSNLKLTQKSLVAKKLSHLTWTIS